MNDKEIKQKLKDASMYLDDAAKWWTRDPEVAQNRLRGALAVIAEIRPHIVWEGPQS